MRNRILVSSRGEIASAVAQAVASIRLNSRKWPERVITAK